MVGGFRVYIVYMRLPLLALHEALGTPEDLLRSRGRWLLGSLGDCCGMSPFELCEGPEKTVKITTASAMGSPKSFDLS